MVKLSLIVPVYNTGIYLRKCIDSILIQQLKEIEIIGVDDGSSDDSVSILCEYARNDKRVKVFRQEHEGVSCARNRGIQEAQGEYIMFVDSDDYLLPGVLHKLYDKAKKEDADILVFRGKTDCFWKTAQWTSECFATHNAVYNSFTPEMFFQEHGVRPVIWNKVFRREMLMENEIYFQEKLVIGEDQAFDFAVFPVAKKICFSRRKAYCYRVAREGSAMQLNEGKLRKAEAHLEAVHTIWQSWQRHEVCQSGDAQLWQYLVEFLYATTMELEERQGYARDVITFLDDHMPREILLHGEAGRRYEALKFLACGEEEKCHELFPTGIHKIGQQCRNNIRYLREYGALVMGKKIILKLYRVLMRRG